MRKYIIYNREDNKNMRRKEKQVENSIIIIMKYYCEYW